MTPESHTPNHKRLGSRIHDSGDTSALRAPSAGTHGAIDGIPDVAAMTLPSQLGGVVAVLGRQALATALLGRLYRSPDAQAFAVERTLLAPDAAQNPPAVGFPLVAVGTPKTIELHDAVIDVAEAFAALFDCLAPQFLQTVSQT